MSISSMPPRSSGPSTRADPSLPTGRILRLRWFRRPTYYANGRRIWRSGCGRIMGIARNQQLSSSSHGVGCKTIFLRKARRSHGIGRSRRRWPVVKITTRPSARSRKAVSSSQISIAAILPFNRIVSVAGSVGSPAVLTISILSTGGRWGKLDVTTWSQKNREVLGAYEGIGGGGAGRALCGSHRRRFENIMAGPVVAAARPMATGSGALPLGGRRLQCRTLGDGEFAAIAASARVS